MHPFRFGLQTSMAPDMRAWRDLARRVESLGYDTLFIPDHFDEQFGVFVALAVAAEATTTLKVGSLVVDNDYRHPVVLAKEAATLDLASEGRLEFGIGAGWMKTDYEASGIPYDPPGVRIDRMQEAIDILKSLWSTGVADYSGTHYQLRGAKCAPQPYTLPHPPIIIGGGGKRVLSIAGREADIVGINPDLRAGYVGPEVAATSTAEFYRRRIDWVREAAGDRFAAIELQVLTFFVSVVPNRREVAEQLAPMFGVTADDALEIPLALLGTVDEICETLVERRDKYGLSYIVVHEPEMEAFAEVVARLAGK